MLATKSLRWLKEYASFIDAQLTELFPGDSQTVLERAIADALYCGGKRVRAVLALLWCELFSGDCRAAIPAGVAYELAHASALVQRDIIHSSEMGRGAIVSKYGLRNAILASDLLLFNLPKMIAKYERLESAKISKLFYLVGEACMDVTRGEFLDLEMARSDEVSELEYEEMIRCKTATLLAAPCASGAIIGGASEECVKLAYAFGEWLGLAYQVQDDLLGDEETLWKSIFNDMRGGKKNIALIHSLNHCSGEERRLLVSLFNRVGAYDEQEVSRAQTVLETHGSVGYARARYAHYIQQAKIALSTTQDCNVKRLLLELSDNLLVI